MLLKKLQKKDTNNNTGHGNNENQCTHLNEINGVCKWNQFQKYCNAMSGNMQVTTDRWCANAYANNAPNCIAPFFWSFTSVLHACWLVSMVIQLNYTINAQIFLIVCLRKQKKNKNDFFYKKWNKKSHTSGTSIAFGGRFEWNANTRAALKWKKSPAWRSIRMKQLKLK